MDQATITLTKDLINPEKGYALIWDSDQYDTHNVTTEDTLGYAQQ